MESPTGCFVVLADQSGKPHLSPILAWLGPMSEGMAFSALVLLGSGRGGFPATIKRMQFSQYGVPDREENPFAFGIITDEFISEDMREQIQKFRRERDREERRERKQASGPTNPTNPTNQ